MRLRAFLFSLLVVLAIATTASAQQGIANPGDAARSGADHVNPPPGTPEPGHGEGHVTRHPTYEQPPVEGGGSGDGIEEEDRIGSYGQPRWTAHRRFATTRVYVRPEGFFELEWWIRPEVEHGGGGKVSTLTEFEAELGLGHRIQLDVYLDARKTGHEGSFELDGEVIELRYGLADWGVLPGNPALYIEYHAASKEPDAVEMKLLFGGELAPRWHWGLNAVFERQLSGDLTNEYGATAGLSYTVLDSGRYTEGLSVGAEVKTAFTDKANHRGNVNEEVLVGPSIQWRPYPASHIDVVALFGTTGHSPQFAPFIVFGWEF